MTDTFRLGRIAGVDIGLNWTWILVFALVVAALSTGAFPERHPGLSDGTYAAMGVVAALLFFGSILLHELGHAVQARREGMEIEGITLWLFGGVAKFAGMFPSAGAELRIALAGPAVTVALIVVFLGGALALPLPEAVDGVVFWLGWINLIVLVFNMLPALPLDGGRVLRSLLWARHGEFTRATRSAALLGRGFGQFLIGAGIVLFFLGAFIPGLWLAFIGWFLFMAATAERQMAEQRLALGGVRVRDAMTPDPDTVAPDMPLAAFVDEVFPRTRRGSYPVVEGGRAVGILPFRNALEPGPGGRSERVADRMVPVGEAIVVDPETALQDVVTDLARGEVRRALVCRGSDLVGLLSITDVLRLLEARVRQVDRP